MPRKRILPSERISKEIMELIQNINENSNNQKLLSQLIQLSMRKLIQEYIGRAYYEYNDNCS